MAYSCIDLTSADGIATLTFNRPKALNALNSALLAELADAIGQIGADESLRVLILTGAGEKSFIAGADITEIATLSPLGAKQFAQFGQEVISSLQALPIPVIAAVNGFALGGGCELAMLCDFIIAAESAKFGQPEINLGVAPGIGGTQRLTRFVGKSKAMEMILTGRMMDSAEAERSGLVSRVVAGDKLIEEAMAAATKIAGQSPLAVKMNKELVEAAYETTLATGVALERRLFHSLFAFDDQKEGMAAFVEKRKPDFKGS